MDVTHIERYDNWLSSGLHVDPSHSIALYCLVCHCPEVWTLCLVDLVHWIVVCNHSGQTCVAAPLSIMMCIVFVAPLFVVADLFVVIAIADHGNDMDWRHVVIACGWDWRKWLLSLLLSRVVLTVPPIVIVVVVPLCCRVFHVIAFSLSNVVYCHSAVFGVVSCSSTSVACVCRLFSFALSFAFAVSFAESFVSFVASSEWIAEADRTVVVAIEPFSSILCFSFVVDVVTVVSVAVVSSVAFAFVLSFSFAFSFVTVVLAFSYVDCINVHRCLSTTEACCHAG